MTKLDTTQHQRETGSTWLVPIMVVTAEAQTQHQVEKARGNVHTFHLHEVQNPETLPCGGWRGWERARESCR